MCYTDQQGNETLRIKIAETFANIDPNNVNVCAPSEGIYLAMNSLLHPKDHVVITTPCYQSLSEFPRVIGCDISEWLPKGLTYDTKVDKNIDDLEEASHNRPWFDPLDLRKLIQLGRTKAVIANFPHNPTGALPTSEQFEQIVQTCKEVIKSDILTCTFWKKCQCCQLW